MKSLSALGIFVIGAAIGAAANYILTKDKFDAEREEDHKAMWDYVNKEIAKYKGTSEAMEQNREMIKDVKDKLEKFSTPYNKMSSIDNEKEDDVVLAEKQYPVEITDDIFEIGFAEFENGEPTYEKIQLTYYEGDTTLTDDQDEPIDYTDALNEDCIATFAESSENVMYFRNMKQGCDYELVRALGEYKDKLGDI